MQRGHDTDRVVGRRLPTASGKALTGRRVVLPDDLVGGPSVLLVAYRRQTQTDIDRWRGFLEREAAGLRVLEVPVIPALVWRPLGAWIDGGMRGGVPRDLWPDVVTVYATGERLREFFGDSGASNAIVALLDDDGVVRWWATAGFTPDAAHGLLDAVAVVDEERGDAPPTTAGPAAS